MLSKLPVCHAYWPVQDNCTGGTVLLQTSPESLLVQIADAGPDWHVAEYCA